MQEGFSPNKQTILVDTAEDTVRFGMVKCLHSQVHFLIQLCESLKQAS